ncbi:HNH endonuclease [Dyadobacter chenhuakuii]|uniref:HNH endonuclease n=1 Tax=Dyadobacter chenhuakuii TaxID=2909339 RepID=A0ABY4XMC6_9BACT|nr:HNH endonuclease [Dyadobacter chenhuakuii]MCF2494286.1 HNH endonuclease [Dyadobacter chenhuakuii]USJ31411.1 HNH endonuclease [Dyadobacter chenhuakuii]
MNYYLFVWNPLVWEWPNLEQAIEQINERGSYIEDWSCSAHRKVKPGDRAFLMKLGVAPKGIIGSAIIISDAVRTDGRRGEEKIVSRMRVKLDFDILLNPDVDPILPYDILNQGEFSKQNWLSQSSGISIRPNLVAELEALWFDFVSTQGLRNNPFTAQNEQHLYMEGASNQILVTKYERNIQARKRCLEHHGYSCMACKLNFRDRYGDVGKNYIHVHHKSQISKIGKSYSVNPLEDLVPVCPNCHAMIHQRQNPYTIEEVSQFLDRTTSDQMISS